MIPPFARPEDAVLAEEVRSGLVETVHEVPWRWSRPSGELIASYGDIDRPFYFRSSAKPFQAAVSQACGAGLVREQLAVACASHDGRTGPRRSGRVDPGRGGARAPTISGIPPAGRLSGSAERRLVAAGATGPNRLWHNCSGKHAGDAGGDRGFGLGPRELPRSRSPSANPDHRIPCRDVAGPVEPDRGGWLWGSRCSPPPPVRWAGHLPGWRPAPEFLEVFDAMHAFPALVSGVGNVDAAIATHLDAVAKRGAAGVLGIGLRGTAGTGGQGLGRLGSGRRGGRRWRLSTSWEH